MEKRESLKRLAETYLTFLIRRDLAVLRPFLSLDFVARQRAVTQLKMIRTLPPTLNYGIAPEAHLWREYVTADGEGGREISPFQFDVSFRDAMNPLKTETMVVTVHKLRLENERWRVAAVLGDADEALLRRYAAQPAGIVAVKNRLATPKG